jgi:hypothetical protein
VRVYLPVLTCLLLTAFTARAQTSIQSFTWQQNARFDLRFTVKSVPMEIKGELRDGARQSYQTKDLQTTAEFKSYTTELFLVIAITSENDDTGSIFLLERPQSDWLVMNPAPIHARKLAIMDDFETAMKDFKTVTDFSLANSMRKTVEYFAKNPNKRLQDLLSALENRDESLRVLPRPRGGVQPGNQGVVPGEIPGRSPQPAPVPSAPAPAPRVTPVAPANPLIPEPYADEEEQPKPKPRRRRTAEPPADTYGQPFDPYAPQPDQDSDWTQRERARQRRQREQNRRRVYTDPYTGQPRYYPSERPPMDIRPQYAPPAQYSPQYAPPQRRGGFFENLFGQ